MPNLSTSSEYAKDIVRLEAEISQKIAELDKIIEECAEALEEWLPGEFQKRAAQVVQDNAGKALELGPAALKRVKAEIDALSAGLHEKIAVALRPPEKRWYRRKQMFDSVYNHSSLHHSMHDEISLDLVLQKLVGLVGEVLNRNQLLNIPSADWRWANGGSVQSSYVTFGEYDRLKDSYLKAAEQLIKAHKSLETAKSQKTKAEAAELWQQQ